MCVCVKQAASLFVFLLSLGLACSLLVTSRCQPACVGWRCCLRSLNSVRECRISAQAWLLEVAAIINTAIPPLPQPAILQQLLCIYLHDTAAVSLTPKAPFASPGVHTSTPLPPVGLGCSCPVTDTQRVPHQQSSRAGAACASTKECGRQNPRTVSPHSDPVEI